MRPVRLIFFWWCYEWNLRNFQFDCATFSWPVNFSSGHFLNCMLYNHNWVAFLGASETESFISTPDFSDWSRTNLTWATMDETWLDCGSLFFLFHDSGTPIDPTLSSRCDTIGTDHKWTELWFLTLLNEDLPILFIRKLDCNGTIYHILITTWEMNFYNTNDPSLGNILRDCFGKADLRNSGKFNSFCILVI